VPGPAARPKTALALPTHAPLSVAELRTTNGDLYVHNLGARLESAEAAWEGGAGPPAKVLALASVRYERYRALGRLEDYDTAVSLVESATTHLPLSASGDALLLRAELHAAMHRFDAAQADLDAALAAHAKVTDVEPVRAELSLALGRYADAIRFVEKMYRDKPSMGSAMALGAVRFEEGKVDEAMRLYTEAPGYLRDVSPLPVAALAVQHGAMYDRLGDFARAREFFAAAHERLPTYAAATEHLAETELKLGHHDEAARLYAEVAAQTDNPEFWAGLASAERARGNATAAGAAEAKARAGFDDWLKRHPEAFWDHAARYHLDRGEAAVAADLARKNASVRADAAALSLLARAEAAAGQAAAACVALGRLRATAMHPPELAALEKTLGPGCAH
jgi:tetratricopeptide (TPR) repeat protein